MNTLLKKSFYYRIVRPLKTNFFIAPTPEMDIEMIEVLIKVSPEEFDNSTTPALLLWDSFTFNYETQSMFLFI